MSIKVCCGKLRVLKTRWKEKSQMMSLLVSELLLKSPMFHIRKID